MTPHGHIVMNWQDNRLHLDTMGPFNIEGAKIAFKDLQESIRKNGTKSWSRIDITCDNTLGEPEVMKLFGESYLWGFANGCQTMALVYQNALQKIMSEKFIHLHSLNIKTFDCKENAIAWLDSL